MANQLDEAFNWLVVILGIIAGALTQFPGQAYPLVFPGLEVYEWLEVPLNIDYILLRLLIFPVVVLVLFWLWGHLTRRIELQVMVKFFSWILASIILIVDLVILGPSSIVRAYLPQLQPTNGPPITVVFTAVLCLILIFAFPLCLCFFVVRPRMREIYTDSKFLHSLPMQVLLYIAAALLYFSLLFLENILLGENSAAFPQWS